MAGQPHDATGKTCGVCGKQFDRTSMTLSINRRETINGTGYITRIRVCAPCHNDHMERNE